MIYLQFTSRSYTSVSEHQPNFMGYQHGVHIPHAVCGGWLKIMSSANISPLCVTHEGNKLCRITTDNIFASSL